MISRPLLMLGSSKMSLSNIHLVASAKTLRLTPPACSTEMIAYGVAQQTAGGAATALRLGYGGQAFGRDQIKGPVPVSMPAPLLAKKNKVKGNVETMLEVDSSGSVAGIMEMIQWSGC